MDLQKWVEIDLSSLIHNLNQLKKFHPKVLPVIKSNAYGHGLIEVAKRLESYVDTVCVISTDEGEQLREAGFKRNILILGSFFPFEKEVRRILKYNLIPTVSSIEELKALGKTNRSIKFHLMINTGMNREGISVSDLPEFINTYVSSKNLKMEAIYTHFSSAYFDKEYTMRQIDLFNFALKTLRKANLNPTFIHAANSAASVLYPQAHYDAIRPGIALYGLLPFKGAERYINLKPVLSWKARIVLIRHLPKGSAISYGQTYVTKRKSKIAVIPVGYADGYSRLLSNKSEVLLHGRRVKVVGVITMDMTMLDVTDIKDVKVGDEVVLIGAQGNEKVTAEEIADLLNTINYEIVCKIHPRVKRIYKN